MSRPEPGIDISVVVPVYNGENYLADCLGSVAAAVDALEPARREHVEVIICDNHSTDHSREIAEETRFSCASRVVSPPEHEENRTRNWGYGLGQGCGRWLMMLHHDDLLAEGGLDAQLRHCTGEDVENVTMIVGRHRTFGDPASPGPLRPIIQPSGTVPGRLLQERVLAYHCPFVPFILFRRRTFEAVGGLDPRWQLVQDWELWMRLAEEGDLRFHGEEVGWWRVHGTSPGYRNMNAREHVELARDLAESMPAISADARRRAGEMALRRASLQLAEVSDPDIDLAWLDGESLPEPSAAETRHTRELRRIGVELAVLRLYGAVRRRQRQLSRHKALAGD